LEENVTALENGLRGIATASGMAAISSTLMALLRQNDHVIAGDCLYGPSEVLIETELPRYGITSTLVDTTKTANIEAAIQPNTKLIYIETPANPTLSITDIRQAAAIAHRHGALLVADNTFASPYLQRPLELGADVLAYSLTKFINGHSDVVGGMIVIKQPEIYEKIRRFMNIFGGVMDPHQAWLILRGVRTLPLRLEKAQENAAKLALFLHTRPQVLWVRYPGLPDHPQHEIAGQQMDGYGAMLCFGVKKGLEGGRILMNNVRLITLAVSLGGVDSLIEHPATMTHYSVPLSRRLQAGIGDELVRLSVGCEDFKDLRADLDQALSKIG
jgi:methionine-gamma-lyase